MTAASLEINVDLILQAPIWNTSPFPSRIRGVDYFVWDFSNCLR